MSTDAKTLLEVIAKAMGGTLTSISPAKREIDGETVWEREETGEGEWLSKDQLSSWRQYPDGRVIGIREGNGGQPVVALDRILLGEINNFAYRIFFGFADEQAEANGALEPIAERCIGPVQEGL